MVEIRERTARASETVRPKLVLGSKDVVEEVEGTSSSSLSSCFNCAALALVAETLLSNSGKDDKDERENDKLPLFSL